jgi:hypothetical protein
MGMRLDLTRFGGHRDKPVEVRRTHAMTKQRGNVLWIVLSGLIPRARQPDPRSRSIDACSSAREHRRELRMNNPTSRANARRVSPVLEQHRDHRNVVAFRGRPKRSRAAEGWLIRVHEKLTQRLDARAGNCVVRQRAGVVRF